MAQTQILKRRIRSVGNTRQITKAMELVAAAKMRRVQEAARKSRIYSDAAIGLLQRFSHNPEVAGNPFFRPPAGRDKLYVIFNSDSGLAGAYNTNIFNAASKIFAEDNKGGLTPKAIVFGRKGASHFSRGTNIELIGDYEGIADDPDINVFAPVLETINDGLGDGLFSSVTLIFTESITTMSQQVRTLQLVPIQSQLDEAEKENIAPISYEFEPESQAVLDSALKLYIESAIRRARVEAAASEHAMRMMSMGNANRNAGDLIDSLTLELNATRQAAITQEMAEIIAGANAIV